MLEMSKEIFSASATQHKQYTNLNNIEHTGTCMLISGSSVSGMALRLNGFDRASGEPNGDPSLLAVSDEDKISGGSVACDSVSSI